jgi:hypothetical protein
VIGLGAGQQSRIHCTRMAGDKADNWYLWWLAKYGFGVFLQLFFFFLRKFLTFKYLFTFDFRIMRRISERSAAWGFVVLALRWTHSSSP